MSLLLKFRYRFEAGHRLMTAKADACQTPHGHTWYATALFKLRAGARLDDSAMAAEFTLLKKNWKLFISETVDHSFFHNHRDPLVGPLLNIHPEARLLPFPGDPTTEMVAGLFAIKLQSIHSAESDEALKHVELTGMHIQETPTNSITFRFEKNQKWPMWLSEQIGQATGWWNTPKVLDRSLKYKT